MPRTVEWILVIAAAYLMGLFTAFLIFWFMKMHQLGWVG